MSRSLQLLIVSLISVTAGLISYEQITPDAERVAGHVAVRQVLAAAQQRALLEGGTTADWVPTVIAEIPDRDQAALLDWDGQTLTWRYGTGCVTGRAVEYGQPWDERDCGT